MSLTHLTDSEFDEFCEIILAGEGDPVARMEYMRQIARAVQYRNRLR